MCGPTSAQKQITQEQQDFYNQLSNQYSTIFGQNQAITGALTQAFTPILQAGPGQFGMTPAEETSLRTQAAEQVGTDYAHAQTATMRGLAALGGGNTFLPSSITANIAAQNANLAAAQNAQLQTGITTQGYNLGRQNWLQAAQTLGGTAQLLNPVSYGGMASTAGANAMTSATDIANTAFQPWGAAIGAAAALGGAAMRFA